MKIYRLALSESTIPIYVLPLKFKNEGKWQVGFVMYWINKKMVTKDYIINENHGILQFPEVDKDQNEIDAEKINTADELLQLFLDNFDGAGLNKDIINTFIEVDCVLSEEEKHRMIDNFDIEEEGKFENTTFLT